MLLAYPFRIFFLSAAIYAVLIVFAWMAFLFGHWPLPVGWAPMQWHSHEMLYGFLSAPIAGFILTAITNWTGCAPLKGKALFALFLLWVFGRALMWLAAWINPWFIAAVDLAFLGFLTIYILKIISKHKNRRNLILVLILSLLFMGNAIMHAGFITGKVLLLKQGQLIGLDLIVILIAIIGGRIIPAFSKNWLMNQGQNNNYIKTWPIIEISSIASLAAVLLSDLFLLKHSYSSALVIFSAVIHSIRLYGWSGWLTLREPLLWILHIAYLWLVVALYFRGLSAFTNTITDSVWQHTLGVGAIGTIILGVMTRVTMGHTGNPLKLLKWGIVIYISITVAAILRVLVALNIIDFRLGVNISAIAWVIAFASFIALYSPALLSPRADGRPG